MQALTALMASHGRTLASGAPETLSLALKHAARCAMPSLQIMHHKTMGWHSIVRPACFPLLNGTAADILYPQARLWDRKSIDKGKVAHLVLYLHYITLQHLRRWCQRVHDVTQKVSRKVACGWQGLGGRCAG